MAEQLCQVCNAQPKKYKCPTCGIPYCSLPCFKQHKPTHDNTTAVPAQPLQPAASPTIDLPQPPPPAPVPRYLKQKTDFSVLASDPRFQDLLKSNPTLLPALQKVYAATIEPEPEDVAASNANAGKGRGRGRGRGFGRGDWRGRGRGRGRGGRGAWGGNDRGPPKWSEKKGDADALKLLKKFREGKGTGGAGERGAVEDFVRFVGEKFEAGGDDDAEEGGEAMQIV